jgi:hypothetical protein
MPDLEHSLSMTDTSVSDPDPHWRLDPNPDPERAKKPKKVETSSNQINMHKNDLKANKLE